MQGTVQGLRDFRGADAVVLSSRGSISQSFLTQNVDHWRFHRPLVPPKSLSETRWKLRFRDGQGR